MTLGMTDSIAVVMLFAGTAILVNGSVLSELAIRPSTSSARDIVLLLAIPAVFAVIFGFGTSADRRCADDFAFQLLATSAMVGMFTMIGVNTLWALDFLADAIDIRGLRGQDMMAIGMVGWGVGYFGFRIRGGVR
jgi:hypothetical protein